jgi:DNA-binding MarR family transcriptional regulator
VVSDASGDGTKRDGDLDAKLLGALDRAGHALEAELRRRARDAGVTATQAKLLLRLGSGPPRGRQVRALAAEFDVSQPTVSDSVAALERKQLVRRRPGRGDRRVVELELTTSGRRLCHRLRGWDERPRAALDRLDRKRKEQTLVLLLELLADLHGRGVIAEARMCTTCRYFRGNAGADAYCALLEIPLTPPALRTDCPEHEDRPAAA